MSLIARYPLNGTLKDNLCNQNWTSETPIYSVGKSGQCIESLWSRKELIQLKHVNVFSCSIWARVDSTCNSHYANIISFEGTNQNNQFFSIRFDNERSSTIANTSMHFHDNSTGQFAGDQNLVYEAFNNSYNEWHNYIMTADGQYLYIYVNGRLKLKRQILSGSFLNGQVTSNTIAKVLVSDIQIYDHCLSLKEIKDIYHCCALDYNFTESSVNLGNTSANYSNMNENHEYNLSGWGGDKGTVTYHYNDGYNNYPYKRYHRTHSGTGGVYSKTTNDIKIEAGKTYTMSVYIRASRDFTDSSYNFNINRGSDNYYITHGKNTHFTTQWQRISRTFTATEAQAGLYGEMSIIYNDDVEDYWVEYSGFQIEENDHPTPFIMSSRLDNKVYDSSGYNRHGIARSTLTTHQEKSGCGNFYGSLMTNENIRVLNTHLNTIQKGAIAFWARYLNDNRLLMVMSDENSSGRYIGAERGSGWYSGNSGSLTYYCDGIRDNFPHRDNQWHFYVFNNINLTAWSDNINISSYVNNINNEFQFHGDCAEYKVYATPLSEQDIINLYKDKACITSQQQFITNELEEQVTNLAPTASYEMYTGNNQNLLGWDYPIATYDTIQVNGKCLKFYTQSNCQVEMIAGKGAHIYRAPNILASGHTNYGGIAFKPMYYNKDSLQKGHTYIITWEAKGHSKDRFEIYWTSQHGWGHADISPKPTILAQSSNPTNFNGHHCYYYEFKIEDDIFKKVITASSNTHFKVGQSYLSYADFVIGYTYSNTDSQGTDIYISNLQLFDITDIIKREPEISIKGILSAINVIEDDTTAIYKTGLVTANEFIEN